MQVSVSAGASESVSESESASESASASEERASETESESASASVGPGAGVVCGYGEKNRNRRAVSPVLIGKFCCTSALSLPPKGGLARITSYLSFSWISARFSASVLVWMILGASMPWNIIFIVPII